MKKLFTLSAVVLLVHAVSGQCSSGVPASSQVISTTSGEPITVSGQTFWVCPSMTVIVIGNSNTFFVETNGTAIVSGNGNNIRTKGAVGVTGDNNTIYIQDAQLVYQEGNNNQVNICPTGVTFNYTSAPSNGCSGISAIGDVEAPIALAISPNPMADHLNIMVDDGNRIQRVRMFDMNGRTVLTEEGNSINRIDVGHLKAGLFFAIIETEEGIVVRKVQKD